MRDTCRLRPGLAGVSSTIKVVSIIGRFLEHGRIYYFHNGGRAEYYIGSADAMQRNLEKPRRGAVPDRGSRACRPSCATCSTPSSPTSAARGTCSPTAATCSAPALGAKHSQQQLIERTERRLKEATRLRRRKVQSTTARKRR